MRVEPQENYPPYKIETGTLNHEGIAGAAEAIEFIADIGAKFGKENEFHQKVADLESRRRKIVAGLLQFDGYEQELTDYLIEELSDIRGIRIYGPPEGYPRTSTVSFTYAGYSAREVAQYLDTKGIFVWDGDFFATKVVERLGLSDQGGLVRIGISPYNTREELTWVIEALKDEDALRTCARNKR